MAKRIIRFPLKMKNGAEVRTIEELRENFDIDTVLSYFTNGKLAIWLRDRYYDDLSKAVMQLSADSKNIGAELCSILGVDYHEPSRSVSDIKREQEKLRRYRELLGDETYTSKISQIAIDQNDLDELVAKGIKEIYLFKGEFTIDLSKTDITYIGIDNVTVKAKNMNFEDIFNIDKFKNTTLLWIDKDDDAVRSLLDALRKNSHNKSAVFWIGVTGTNGSNVSSSVSKSIVKTLTSISEDAAEIYKYGKLMKNCNAEASTELFKSAANSGSSEAMYAVARSYEYGIGTDINLEEAVKWYGRAYHAKHSMALGEIKRLSETNYCAKQLLDRINPEPVKKSKYSYLYKGYI